MIDSGHRYVFLKMYFQIKCLVAAQYIVGVLELKKNPSQSKMNNTNQSALLPNKNLHFRFLDIGLLANQVLLERGVMEHSTVPFELWAVLC